MRTLIFLQSTFDENVESAWIRWDNSFIYRFLHSRRKNIYEYQVLSKILPGLSS